MAKVRFKSNLHKDSKRIQLQKDGEEIVYSGTLDQFKRVLHLAGIDPESIRGKELIDRWISLGAGGRSPR
jgi:hypothetical protein